ncbi:ATP-binding cassette domain-containing protein [Nocardioides marinquilinus]|uniref:ATP-binding cassette domain-containing protein n=1 Tax=Nocardioides marinquilinus TaxID=1210400 RepID=A0ABP9P651_9ACTN
MTLSFDVVVRERDVEVAFEVADGETVALLGPNGAGKSTVLAVTAGLLRPDAGRVLLGDRVLTSVGDGATVDVAPHRRGVALLAQDPLLFPHLTARENVAFGPRSLGAPRREARRTAERWLAEVGVDDLADRRPAQLSGGQAQRVAVARALAADPRLLLLDEPMAALDVAVAPALRQVLRRVLADRTAVVVTHDVLDALLLADRVVVLEAGRVVEAGPSSDVLTHPRSGFAARLAGLNLVRGRWDDDAVRSAGLAVRGQSVGPTPAAGEEAVATFRPQAVAVFREPPAGSPRNAFAVTVTDLEPVGDVVRVRGRADGTDGDVELRADVTPQSVAELDLVPGLAVTFSVKATEVSVYGL